MLEKFIEKILNKYYAKKLMDFICENLLIYYIDKQVIYGEKLVSLYVKRKKWDTKYYELVASFSYDECFKVYINQLKESVKQIRDRVEEAIERD